MGRVETIHTDTATPHSYALLCHIPSIQQQIPKKKYKRSGRSYVFAFIISQEEADIRYPFGFLPTRETPAHLPACLRLEKITDTAQAEETLI